MRTLWKLQTERLVLRHWHDEDIEPFAEFYADEEMTRYLGGPCSPEQAWRRMAAEIGHWVLRGYGYWAVEESETERFVGGVGLWFPAGWPEIELGYWITRGMQGKGYAIEAACKARDHAFEVLDTDSLVSYIHPDNEPSKRVAEKLGAHFEQLIELGDHGPHCVYRHVKEQPKK